MTEAEHEPTHDDLPPASPEDEPEQAHGEDVDASYRGKAVGQATLVTAASAAALTYAFRFDSAGPAGTLLPVGLTYLVLAVGTVRFASFRGDLREQLRPRRLDLTIGALVAGVLYLVGSLLPALLLQGRPQEGWLWRLYIQLGDPREVAAPYVGVAVLAVAALEEVVWRGWVLRALRVAFGANRALLATTALYALAHVGTMFVLRDADAGLNPSLVAAALGCGLVWGTMAVRFERLAPSVCAHALFSWAVVLFPMWKRLGGR